ncbi:MAG: tyrosine-type recombinase/integrase [Micrococcales bacterium]|nr:tyrosine-type recombinase/integrase [Micrococcales bacterium]
MTRTRATTTDSLGRKRKTTRAAWGMVRQLPSGRLQASYVGPDGQRHTAPRTFATRTDADSWLATQRAAIVEGRWTPASATQKHAAQAARAERFDAYARRWITTRTGRDGAPLRGRTSAEYERLLSGPLADLGLLPLTAITSQTVREWYAELVSTGRRTTAARAYGLLRSVLQTAVLDGIVPTNPCQVRGAGSASSGKKVTPPTSAELAIIEAAMPDHLRAAVVLAAWGALRFGELTELRRKDLTEDGDALLVRVERAVTHIAGKGFVVGEPKSAAGVRVVVIPARLAVVVRDHLEKYAQPGPDGLLFPSANGGHLAQSTLTRAWYPARAAAGRDDLPWHGLRHYGLTRYAQTGATLREIQARAGHSTIAAAMRYQHAAGRDAELAARMADLA